MMWNEILGSQISYFLFKELNWLPILHSNPMRLIAKPIKIKSDQGTIVTHATNPVTLFHPTLMLKGRIRSSSLKNG